MLCLSRGKGERIMIGDSITVEVVEIRGDKVRFGIVAPRDVPVHREEVYQAIRGGDHANALEANGGQPGAAAGGVGSKGHQ